MTDRPIKNMAASVQQRLQNLARAASRVYNDLLQLYALERWLFRLAASPHRDRFLLKGGLLLNAWSGLNTRPTRDIDLLGRVDNGLESVRNLIAEICSISVPDDGMNFHAAGVQTMRIAEDADYHGVRAVFEARLGTARIKMQVDIGFSDVVTPAPTTVAYPSLLDHPPAHLPSYNQETVIAEKLEAMVKLGELNSRLKDFFDVWSLCESFDFRGPRLTSAVSATFRRRGTAVEAAPPCFGPSFAADETKQRQWSAFLKRSKLSDAPDQFVDVVARCRDFLAPVLASLIAARELEKHWSAGVGWREPAEGEIR